MHKQSWLRGPADTGRDLPKIRQPLLYALRRLPGEEGAVHIHMKYQPFHTVFLIPELSETSVSSFSQALQRKPFYNHASAHSAALPAHALFSLMIQKNVHVNIIPFTIDVDVSAHQIPSSPMIPLRTMASGILALVSTILITLQSLVLPSPDSAPIVVSSTHINASLNPMITR